MKILASSPITHLLTPALRFPAAILPWKRNRVSVLRVFCRRGFWFGNRINPTGKVSLIAADLFSNKLCVYLRAILNAVHTAISVNIAPREFSRTPASATDDDATFSVSLNETFTFPVQKSARKCPTLSPPSVHSRQCPFPKVAAARPTDHQHAFHLSTPPVHSQPLVLDKL